VRTIGLAGLLQWDRPEGTVRLIDGGTMPWGADQYRSKHPLVGRVTKFEALAMGVGDIAPGGRLTFDVPGDVAGSAVSHGALQGTRLRLWCAEYDPEDGSLIGEPKLELDAIVDVTWWRPWSRKLEVDYVSRAQWLLMRDRNNVLSGEAHRRIYPTERGLDNMVAVPRTVAWGVAAPPRGTSVSGGAAQGGSLGGDRA
jgi:hypothetical protein